MEALVKFAEYIQKLSKKEFEKYLLAILLIITIFFAALIYAIQRKSTALASQIKKLEIMANKSYQLLDDYDLIKQEEDRLTTLLEQNKEFDIKIYFEQFCKTQGITSPTWDVKITTLNPQFDEYTLSATIRNQTTEKLVEILQKLDEQEIIHVKNLSIKPEQAPARKISISLAIATIKRK